MSHVFGRLLMALDGFFLDHNESETLYLDDIIFRDLSKTLQEELEFQQYYGYACVDRTKV